MSLSRRVARTSLASMFISGGIEQLKDPQGKVKAAEAVTTRIPQLPGDTEQLVRINGAMQVGAGVLLALGKFRRLASLVLIGSLIPTTYASHRFWEETDEEARKAQMTHFFKNVGLLGGLLLAALDTEGAPSLSWRAKRAMRRSTSDLASTAAAAAGAAKGAGTAAAGAGKDAGKKVAKGGRPQVARGAKALSPLLSAGVDRASHAVSGLEEVVSKAADRRPAG